MSMLHAAVRFFLIIPTLWLGACTMLGPDFQTPSAPIPEQWSEQGNELFRKPSDEDSIAWWTLFNDPVLTGLVQIAHRENLSLQNAALRIMEARAQLGVVKGNLLPQVQEMQGELFTTGTAGPSPDRFYNIASVGFDAAWEMDFWGKFRRGIEAADANLLATIANYNDVLVSLTAEVARTYVNIRTLQERIHLARTNAALQRDSLQLVTLQFEAGMVTELDILQAKTLLSSTLATIPNLEASLSSYKNSLAVLLGMLPTQINDHLQPMTDIPVLSTAIALGIPAELLRRRPDIRRAEMQAAAQSAQIGIARTELFPSFTLFGSLTWSATTRGNGNLGDIFDSDSFSYNFGPAFRWNLFNYGRLSNQVRVQDARFQQLITVYRETVLNAAREVEDAMQGLDRTTKEAEFLRQGVETSKRSTELSTLQYREGLTDYQRVLDSTRALTQKQDQYAQVKGRIATYAVALYKAFGGGWQIQQNRPALSPEVRHTMEQRTDWGTLLSQ